VQSPIRVLLLCCPCAPRLQVPCSASRVVPGAHRVVGPGTHRGSGPREVHTTTPSSSPAEPPLFKAAFPPRARRHCHSRRHDRHLSELPFFPSISSPADTPNTSSSSHVSRSLCLWESRKPPSLATPPAAAVAAGPRRAPTPAISPPQLRPPLGPR
jgi:hypothetical protein